MCVVVICFVVQEAKMFTAKLHLSDMVVILWKLVLSVCAMTHTHTLTLLVIMLSEVCEVKSEHTFWIEEWVQPLSTLSKFAEVFMRANLKGERKKGFISTRKQGKFMSYIFNTLFFSNQDTMCKYWRLWMLESVGDVKGAALSGIQNSGLWSR